MREQCTFFNCYNIYYSSFFYLRRIKLTRTAINGLKGSKPELNIECLFDRYDKPTS